jgi:hypothetical protein
MIIKASNTRIHFSSLLWTWLHMLKPSNDYIMTLF